MRPLSLFLFLLLTESVSALRAQEAVQRRADTLSVFFPLDVRTLPDAAIRTLDALQYRGELTRTADFYIIGYADYVGRSSYNDTLSLARATAVKNYLLASGFKESRLRLVTGRGEIPRADSTNRAGFAPDRRVDVVRAKGGFTLAPSAASSRPATPVVPDTILANVPAPAITSIQRLLTIAVDSAVVLNNLYFPHGRHTVYPGSRPVLDVLAATLLAHPTLRVRIEGHVCCIDPRFAVDALDEDTHELALSTNRAKAVMTYLISRGISADRLEAVGFGKSRPVVTPERSAMDTERNRRVELRVLAR